MNSNVPFHHDELKLVRDVIIEEYQRQISNLNSELVISDADFNKHSDEDSLDIRVYLEGYYYSVLYMCHTLSERYVANINKLVEYEINFSKFKEEKPTVNKLTVIKKEDGREDEEQSLAEHVSKMIERLE